MAIIFITQAREASLRKITTTISDEKKVLELRQPNTYYDNKNENNNKLVKASSSLSSINSNIKSRQLKKTGQLESFSSNAIGLGDLEDQDEWKKMTKKRNGQLINYNDVDDIYNELLKQLIEKRRKEILYKQQQYLLRKTRFFDKRNKHIDDVNEGELQATYRPIAVSSTNNHQRAVVDSQLVEPILITRRTEEFLDPQLFNYQQPVNSVVSKSHLFDEQAITQQQPIVGEIGSKVSLLTTRKTQPEHFNHNYGFSFYRPTSRFYSNNGQSSNSFFSNSNNNNDNNNHHQSYSPDISNKMSSYSKHQNPINQDNLDIDEEEDSVPVTSQVLISPRPWARTNNNYNSGQDNKQIEETISLNTHLINDNYLPRIARAFMRRRR